MIAFPSPFLLWPYPALLVFYLKLYCLFTCLTMPASSPECKLHEEETFFVLLTARPGEECLAHNSCSTKLWVRKEWVNPSSWWGQKWCLASTSQSAMLHTLSLWACLTENPLSPVSVWVTHKPRRPSSNHLPEQGPPPPWALLGSFLCLPTTLSASSMQFIILWFLPVVI